MSNTVYNKTECDVPGCAVTVEVEGTVSHVPDGWRWIMCSAEDNPSDKGTDRWLVCSTQAKQIMAILAGKPTRKTRKDKGVNKPTTSLKQAKGGNLTASVPEQVETPTPKKKRGRKPTVKGVNDKLEELGNINPNVCEAGKPQFGKCPGCGERSKCTKDGGASLDCYDERSKK